MTIAGSGAAGFGCIPDQPARLKGRCGLSSIIA